MYDVKEFDEQKTRVLKFILYKKRCESEIRKKFAKTIEPDLLDDIIEYLKKAGYINDKIYIEKTINEYKILKNLSMWEIKYKLLQKGVNKDDIEDYMYENEDELEEYEIKSAENLINKKRKNMDDDIKIKQFLSKKGYKMENIMKAFDE